MEKFQQKTESHKVNNLNLIERLGPLARKYYLLISLIVPAMSGQAQEANKLDESKITVKYENNIEVQINFKKGVDFELKKQNIYFNEKEGVFNLKTDLLSFDDPGSPTDSVNVSQNVKELPGGSKIENLQFVVYNNDKSIEYIIVDGGKVVGYSKEEEK